MSKKEKVLVTGGAGFLGSHISDCLVEHGYEVVLFDRAPSPFKKPGQTEIIGSIEDEKLLCEAMQGCTYVYHLAGIADIDECYKRPFDTVNLNILCTARVIECAHKAQVKKILFSSSAYASSDKGSFYRVSKIASESLLAEYAKKYNFKFVNLRFGTLYGPRADERNNLFRIITQMIENGKIKHRGSGDELREFIHVIDAAELSIKALDTKFDNQTLLLTGNQSISYKSLYSMIKEVLGKDIQVDFDQNDYAHHYVSTPYSYKQDLCRKMIPEVMVDFGQGIVDLISEIHKKKNKDL